MILNILTTATPRPNIHQKTLEPWFRTLYKSKIFNRINWFVNLDKPSMFSAKDFLLAKKYLHKNFYFVNRYYSERLQNPTFALASRNVYVNCNDTIDRSKKNYFMWLEDDWIIDAPAIEHIKNYIESEKDIINLNAKQRVTGNPCIFNQNFFDGCFDVIKKGDTDPEMAMMYMSYDIYPDMIRTVASPRDNLPDRVVYNPGVRLVHDVGVGWKKRKGIIKTSKFIVQQDTWIS